MLEPSLAPRPGRSQITEQKMKDLSYTIGGYIGTKSGTESEAKFGIKSNQILL